MSGICGIINWQGEPVRPEWLQPMLNASASRGPDGSHMHIDSAVGMGYLSHRITPESLTEDQPLVHRPTGVVLTADLRLDNREELLGALGSPAGCGDAELVLAAYLRWGEQCAEHLLGDFAFALWDPRSATVHLARDAMAMRALYYLREPARLVFATDVKQILAAPRVERTLNETAVATHLSGSHIPPGMSYYKGIAQVEPGQQVSVMRQSAQPRRYWQIDPHARLRYRRESEYAEHFRELFLEAVQCRLRSVKPVGISLSGGMDSGSVASAVGWLYEQGRSRHTPPFRAYSWAFDELTQCDERAVSRLITDRYGIPVTDVPADDAWPLRDYPDHGPDEDEPYIFYYDELIDAVLATAAASGVGLLMTGERGDMLVDHWVYDYPGLVRAMHPITLVRELSAHGRAMGLSTTAMAKRYLLKPILRKALRPSSRRASPAPSGRLPAYLEPRYARSAALVEARAATVPASAIPDEARRARHQLIFSAMSARRIELLARGQARHGIDYADPWSDRRLAEFVVTIPQYLVHRYGDFKRIARQALDPLLTDDLRRNADSNAKTSPAPLFERGILDRSRHVVDDLIRGSIAARLGFVNESLLMDDRRRQLAGEPLPYDPWWFLTMEMWLRKFWDSGGRPR